MTQQTQTMQAIERLRDQRQRMLSLAAAVAKRKRFWQSPELQDVADDAALVAEACDAAINGLYGRLLLIDNESPASPLPTPR